ncbi:MAG: hypothetical protein U1E32_05790 [Rhodoglobus sp.]|nr:hypothetical protein [Rhodoglobus sp.]
MSMAPKNIPTPDADDDDQQPRAEQLRDGRGRSPVGVTVLRDMAAARMEGERPDEHDGENGGTDQRRPRRDRRRQDADQERAEHEDGLVGSGLVRHRAGHRAITSGLRHPVPDDRDQS